MIRRHAALALLAVLLAACQSNPIRPIVSRGPAIEGEWRSGDGISVTSFRGGQFTTRFVETNEVLAQGTYTGAGNDIAMRWVSIARQEQLSATCSLTGPATMRCTPAGGSGFDLTRVG